MQAVTEGGCGSPGPLTLWKLAHKPMPLQGARDEGSACRDCSPCPSASSQRALGAAHWSVVRQLWSIVSQLTTSEAHQADSQRLPTSGVAASAADCTWSLVLTMSRGVTTSEVTTAPAVDEAVTSSCDVMQQQAVVAVVR